MIDLATEKIQSVVLRLVDRRVYILYLSPTILYYWCIIVWGCNIMIWKTREVYLLEMLSMDKRKLIEWNQHKLGVYSRRCCICFLVSRQSEFDFRATFVHRIYL